MNVDERMNVGGNGRVVEDVNVDEINKLNPFFGPQSSSLVASPCSMKRLDEFKTTNTPK